MMSDWEIRKLDEQFDTPMVAADNIARKYPAPKVKLVCNECGKKRLVSAEGNYNERCPKCGGVDWDVL